MNTLIKITPYEYEKIGLTTFIINLNGERFLTVENTNEEYVKKTTQLLLFIICYMNVLFCFTD
jgi:hypothetical protein